MPIRLIYEADVNDLITMHDAMLAVETAMHAQGSGRAVNTPRQRVHQPNGVLHIMGGAMLEQRYWGYKAYTTTKHGARFMVALYDSESGAPLALIEANRLGQLRTGAASGVATQYLARHNSRVLALFGTGFQAETQLIAMAMAMPLREVRVYGRNEQRRTAFVERMQPFVKVPLRAVDSPAAALDGADIINTVTTAREPLFDANLLPYGVHINAVGSNSAAKAELDPAVIRQCTQIFTDDVEQARSESGNLILAYERNMLNWANVRPLSEVVAQKMLGRTRGDDVSLFASHGVAIWDIALAGIVYERATAQNLGTLIEFGG